ncbi:D-alanyl-D-alanine carboxypeptidase/D-alanyl-D-alanine-endopeptidase [Labilibaculum sp.]|uniref:D-alanyl-D-alanine carboxypeptidase/D-alanyl-D-alanine endopeptidase n=1 Tax=Labilibaculum sp. TaxID=2060723 RepID=UPI003565C00C
MNKILFTLLISFMEISCSAQHSAQNQLQSYVDAFVADTCFFSASVGIVISDLDNGEQLATNQANVALTPASTQKLLTTAAALEILGSHYHFKTSIETNGELLENGQLNGNLLIKGFGDPTLESKYFASRTDIKLGIAQKLKKLGVSSIHGKIIADDSYINAKIPATWIWEDIGNYYGAVPNGLTYHDNLYSLFFKSGKAESKTQLIKTEPQNTGLLFDNQVLSSNINRDLAYIFGGNTSNQRRIEGSIPQNRNNFEVKGALLDPKISLITKLKTSFTKTEIVLNEKQLSNSKYKNLFDLYSPELKEIVKATNKKSINLFADHLLFEIGQHEYGSASWETGIVAVKNFWKAKGLPTKYISIYDGSGLSHFNAISASFFDQLLQYMHRSNYSQEFISSLPVSGISGTLQNFGKNNELKGKWKAKTGSMSGVRSYCGYLKSKTGKNYSVTVLINNYHCSSSLVNNKLIILLNQLYNS